MLRRFHFAGLAAALLSPSLAQAQVQPQPTQIELQDALRAHFVRIVSYPPACRNGPARGCIKAPKRIEVRNHDCQASGTGTDGLPILYCRVTYKQVGGSLAGVLSRDECVPLRWREVGPAGGVTRIVWEVALVDHKGKCPGARE